MGSLREKVFAASEKLFVRAGLTFPLDCRLKCWHFVYDRHERFGIVVGPRVVGLNEAGESNWWEAYYRLDAEAGELVLTGLANGCPLSRPPQRIKVRGMPPYGSMGFGPDLEQEIITYLCNDVGD
jgi:hypothetical protein